MISAEEAQKTILDNTTTLNKKKVSLYEATGFVIAQEVLSKIDYPPFNQSAMDGYGFRYEDYKSGNKIKVIHELPAGKNSNRTISKNEAVRIFTGAKVPEGVDTVVMQEKTEKHQNFLEIKDIQIQPGANIRKQGSQTIKGELAAKTGKKITPGVAGFLAGLGQYEVKVFEKPRVCIITTGKELVKAGGKISGSKIYESNTYSLFSALKEQDISEICTFTVDDKPKEIENCIKENLRNCDLMIVTGGVSVGDYDFVVESFKNCGVKKVFHKIKQKPGKPLFFGKHRKTLVFGLPGNPSAVLTCFYIYVLPSILKMLGNTEFFNKSNLKLSNDFTKKSGLTYFLKGKKSESDVLSLHAQESYQMNSFAEADCIIKLDETRENYKKGETVEVYNI